MCSCYPKFSIAWHLYHLTTLGNLDAQVWRFVARCRLSDKYSVHWSRLNINETECVVATLQNIKRCKATNASCHRISWKRTSSTGKTWGTLKETKTVNLLCNISKLKPKLSTYGAVFLNRLLMLVVLDSFNPNSCGYNILLRLG